MIKIANDMINKIMLGNNEIARVYLGNDLIYQNKKWVFQKSGKVRRYDFFTNLYFNLREGKSLIVVNPNASTYVSYGRNDLLLNWQESTSGTIVKGYTNANLVIIENKKMVIWSGEFDLNSKTFKKHKILSTVDNDISGIDVAIYNTEKSTFNVEYYKLE